jgi:hypothetical protein
MVPAHRFALISMTNGEPNGHLFNRRVKEWALERFLGLVRPDLIPGSRSADELAAYVGRYETAAAWIDVVMDGDHLSATFTPTPDFIEALGDDADYVEPPMDVRLLPDSDRFVSTEGPNAGERGFFTRDPETNAVSGMHVGGRYSPRSA